MATPASRRWLLAGRARRRGAVERRPARARALSVLGPDPDAARESLVALVVASVAALVAGAALGAISDTLEELPGLLVLVPAAIAMRGNVFGALGSRLSTIIHTGRFTLARRVDTPVGQNVLAVAVLTLVVSAGLGGVAKLVAVAFGLDRTIPVLDLVVISVVGGALSSVVVLVVTLWLAAASVRRGWGLDNVTAPVVLAVGDVVTLPALWLATFLAGIGLVTVGLGGVLVAVSVVVLVFGLRSALPELRLIVRESLPILLLAGTLSAVAGIVLERRLATFTDQPALLVLLPAFLGTAGALGGILSNRLSTKIHLGLLRAGPVPSRSALADIAFTLVLSGPVFALNGLLAGAGAIALGRPGPSVPATVAVALLGGVVAMGFVVAVAYYGTITAVRLGVDPDTYGIPAVTATLDLVGAFALTFAIVALGIG